jgi:hypothetical protein
MAKIKRVLGSEGVYLMDDGSKVPFGEKSSIIQMNKKIVIIDKPKVKKRRKRKK